MPIITYALLRVTSQEADDMETLGHAGRQFAATIAPRKKGEYPFGLYCDVIDD